MPAAQALTRASFFRGICGLGIKSASEPEDSKKARNKRNGKHCFGTILKFLISVPKITVKLPFRVAKKAQNTTRKLFKR